MSKEAKEFALQVVESVWSDGDTSRYVDEYKEYPNDGYSFPWTASNSQYETSMLAEYGGEDQGRDYCYVFKVIDKINNTEKYLKFYGYYDSWSGVEWDYDSPVFVEPIQVTKTEYKEV